VHLTVVPQLGGRLTYLPLYPGRNSSLSVDPLQAVERNRSIPVSPGAAPVVIHLSGERGVDRGDIGEAGSTPRRKDS
jgi:hypothetical protein